MKREKNEERDERRERLRDTLSSTLQIQLRFITKLISTLHTNWVFFDPVFCNTLMIFIFRPLIFPVLLPLRVFVARKLVRNVGSCSTKRENRIGLFRSGSSTMLQC